MSTIYKCHRCDLFKTKRFSDMKKHFNRKSYCKKNCKYMFLSDDQIISLSLIPYYNDNHNITEKETDHLKDSNIIDKNKNKLFDDLSFIEKNKIKKCNLCNMEFNLLNDLKKHYMLSCFFIELNKDVKINKDENSPLNVNNKEEYCNITNITNITNNQTNNQTNNLTNNVTNIYIDIKNPIPFDDIWDISKISESDKSDILISNFMYTKLLEEILKNDINLNVIIDKDKDSALVYQDDEYIEVKLKDIIENTMKKLNDHLNNINKGRIHAFEEIIKFTRQMINKKYIDYNKNNYIQEGVKKCVSDLFENKKDDAIKIAKTVYERKNIEMVGF